MKFVQTTNGRLVNLDFVAEIIPDKGTAKLCGEDGTVLGIISSKELDHLASSIVPANGVTAVILGDYEDEGISAREVHVVAWLVDTMPGGTPILTEDIAPNEIVLIKEPDGTLTAPFVRTYRNLEEAIEVFRKARKLRVDRQ